MTPTISPAVLDLSPLNTTQEKEIKILSLKQMLQRLPIPLAQVKTGNTSDSILKKKKKKRLDKLSSHCMKQSKSQKKHTITYSSQYKDEYDIH